MKKILLTGLALLSLNIVFAQVPGKQALYIYDDFAAIAEYSGTGGQQPLNPDGLYWFPKAADGDTVYVVSRPGDGTLHVDVTGATNFVPFGLTFGDDNGTAAGGNSFIQNFGNSTTGNMNISMTIQNQNLTADDSAYVTFQFVDSLGNTAEYMPDESGISSSWGANPLVQKQKIGFLLLPGATSNINIDISNISGKVGGLYATGYPCSSPMDCPSTSYTIDPSKIAKVIIFVNGDASLDPSSRRYPDISPYNGTLLISNFKVGNAPLAGLTTPVVANNSMTIIPNPASSEVVVSYNGTSNNNVTFNVTDVTGKVVKSVAGNGSSANINVSGLSKGMYFVTTISENAPVSVSKLIVE